MTDPRPTDRLDKWLWQARFFKTRSLATRLVADGQVRVNAARAVKPATAVGPGDVLTFAQGGRIRVIRILALATRRGPAPEAQALYEDLTPPEAPETPRTGPRPTKKDRRALDALRDPEDGPA
ncbi:RNA-binding S4 domain-containing protein [Roseicyclus persicicus]|uniref:RNA-binding S4 domain-containing protein n=1 Tax=Roseicyclus persicicus TaxID=2650661 RepID=A0A7X6GXN0_9RHOB|nr:RNA-binding S4 domain-containing protein [Roseibacterium persicicum]NKX44297.1 RNA-binding S4 domain-containing protein [Roseibacterium persicicum]